MHFIKAAGFHVPAKALARLASDPDVVYISPDRALTSLLSNAAPAINAPYAWSFGYDGTGIGVAIVDSGISGHDDLKDSAGHNRIVYNANFASDSGTNDVYGHGEHVAGIVGGSGKDSICSNCFSAIKGIAPNSNLINLRALDKNGQGTDSSVIAAINKAIQLKSTYNIRVLNLSLGRPVYESYSLDPLCQAVEAAWKAGIVVVVAAGNYGRDNSVGENGYGTITAPANDPYVITVGAMKTMGTPDRSDDLIASYSSKGPTGIDHILKPDLVAPGNVITSLQIGATLEKLYPNNRALFSSYQNGKTGYSDKYYVLSGTSMAAPMVSGAVADLLEAQPQLTPDQVKARLMKTAYKTFPAYSSVTDPSTGITYTDQYDAFTVGAGYVDLPGSSQQHRPCSQWNDRALTGSFV
jgi:serine protease AprX